MFFSTREKKKKKYILNVSETTQRVSEIFFLGMEGSYYETF